MGNNNLIIYILITMKKKLRPEQILVIGLLVSLSSMTWIIAMHLKWMGLMKCVILLVVHFIIGVLIMLYATYRSSKV